MGLHFRKVGLRTSRERHQKSADPLFKLGRYDFCYSSSTVQILASHRRSHHSSASSLIMLTTTAHAIVAALASATTTIGPFLWRPMREAMAAFLPGAAATAEGTTPAAAPPTHAWAFDVPSASANPNSPKYLILALLSSSSSSSSSSAGSSPPRIVFASYMPTDPDIAAALKNVGAIGTHDGYYGRKALVGQPVHMPVYDKSSQRSKACMHHKFLVVNDCVLTGSYNWYATGLNFENVALNKSKK